MKRPQGVCKDCWADYQIQLEVDASTKQPRWRPAPEPGPRCVSHARAAKARRSARTHALKVESGFGIPAEVYWALYEFQGGHCAVLNCRATGKTRRLAVDHDHKCCPGRTSCGKCVRGLLCNPHNEMFGRNGDDPSVFRDMADYLEMPTMMRYLWLHTGTGDLATEYVQGLCPNNCEFRSFRHAHGTTLFQPEPARLQRGALGEQLDRDTGPGGVEQQLGTVRRDRPHASAVDPVGWQGVGTVGDYEVKIKARWDIDSDSTRDTA